MFILSDDVDTLKNNFKKTITELTSLKNMLTNKRDTLPNGMLLTAIRQGTLVWFVYALFKARWSWVGQ
jgi:hypothetical protein